MTTNTGLLPDEWLVSYAAGALTEAQALAVACHAEYHDEMKERIADAEAVGGVLLEGVVPARLSVGALDSAFKAIEALDDEPSPVEPTPTYTDTRMPAPLAALLGKGFEDLKWGFMGPGMKKLMLKTYENGERLWLLRAKGGTKMPFHDHGGLELTLVLAGGYKVGDTHYTPGMMEVAGPEVTHHQPIIDEGEDCICLAVTDAPIKLHSFVGRMFQPFIGL